MTSANVSSADEAMRGIEAQLAHVWMARTFLKHSDEAEGDDELQEVYRALYDYHLAIGPALERAGCGDLFEACAKEIRQTSRCRRDVRAHSTGSFDAHQFSNGCPLTGRRDGRNWPHPNGRQRRRPKAKAPAG